MLDRATASRRVLFSQDEDLLAEATCRQPRGQLFAGVAYGRQWRVTIGKCIADLELLSQVGKPEDFANRVAYPPL